MKNILYTIILSLKHNYIDLICFCGGSYCFVKGLFGFRVGSINIRGRRYDPDAWSAGWHVDDEFNMAIGVTLIVLGFLVRSWRKKSNEKN